MNPWCFHRGARDTAQGFIPHYGLEMASLHAYRHFETPSNSGPRKTRSCAGGETQVAWCNFQACDSLLGGLAFAAAVVAAASLVAREIPLDGLEDWAPASGLRCHRNID